MTALVHYDAARSALAKAHAVDEVKGIRDKAIALQMYAKQAQDIELERQATDIRLRAERRAGELLREMQKAKGGEHGGKRRLDGARAVPSNPAPPLADLGITRKQSSQWQRLAAVPGPSFEAALKDERPTTNGIIAAHAEPKPRDAVDGRALWLWGRLLDFERHGLLDADPNDLLGTMLEHMTETTRRLAPLVAQWLQRITP